jgi:LCP family protein required for cell wall assembly
MGRRLLIGLNVVVAVCLVATGALYGYVQWRFGQVDHVDIGSHAEQADTAGAPVTVLLVGSDSRRGLSAKERKKYGTQAQAGGERTDTILVVRLDPAARSAMAMSIPRDLWVPIAGTSRHDKVNAAFTLGPERLVRTLRESLGISVDHYVGLDFKAFRGVVDALGGVDIPFERPTRDAYTGLNVRRPGCVHLDGDDALNYVRSRHYEQLERGRWQEDQRQDLGRIERQHGFLRALLAQRSMALDPRAVNQLVGSLVSNLTVDKDFSVPDMVRLAKRFHGMSPDGLQIVELPVDVGRKGGQSVVTLKEPGATDAVNRLYGQAPRAAPPAAAAAPGTTASSTPGWHDPEPAPSLSC